MTTLGEEQNAANCYKLINAASSTDPPRHIIVDNNWEAEGPANDYLESLRSRDLSPNTVRMRAYQLAHFLNYCAKEAIDWKQASYRQLRHYRNHLASTPNATSQNRAASTVNKYIATIIALLDYTAQTVGTSSNTLKELAARVPARNRQSYAELPQDQRAHLKAALPSSLKLRETQARLSVIDRDDLLIAVLSPKNNRDYFLLLLLAQTALRIGEALGLRKRDLHFSPASRPSNCSIKGPHIHVVRRHNANGARAKSPSERAVPVVEELVAAYVGLLTERASLVPAELESDFVFVNTFRGSVGAPMLYESTRAIFDRASTEAGVDINPHSLRHSCATIWLENGASRDEVQALLGHKSPKSTDIYIHPRIDELRAAVETTWRPFLELG